MLLTEAEPEPGIDQRRITSRRDRVVRGLTLLDPTGRRRPVEIAHILGDPHRMARRLDPHVRPPGLILARRPDQVADDLAAAGGDGTRGRLRRELGDRVASHVHLLVGRRQAGLVDALSGMPPHEQAGRIVEKIG